MFYSYLTFCRIDYLGVFACVYFPYLAPAILSVIKHINVTLWKWLLDKSKVESCIYHEVFGSAVLMLCKSFPLYMSWSAPILLLLF